MGRILAMDYGLKRTGLAVTDPLKMIAGPLETVATHQLISFLKKYCTTESVETFVIGEPKRMDGSAFEIEKNIGNLIIQLQKEFPLIKIERLDERFTSKMASYTIAQMGLKKKDREKKGLVDEIAAIILLQSYLEKVQ